MMDLEPREPQHPLVKLASAAIEIFVRSGRILAVPEPLPLEMTRPGALFVCLKIGGQLRGCIGTIQPHYPTLAHEAIHNAIGAATRDPRFLPVQVEELPLLRYSIDLLHPPEPVSSLAELDPQRYGVIVSAAERRGLLLPALDGISDATTQVQWALQKAGIKSGESFDLQRFTVERLY